MATATRLWGTRPTLDAWRAFSGSLFSFNSRVDDVKIGTCDGVFKLTLGFWMVATLASARSPKMETEAAVSMNAKFFDGSGGPAQPEGVSVSTMLSALCSTITPSAGSPRQLDFFCPFLCAFSRRAKQSAGM